MASKNKYYVVWRGINPGVYSSWEECKAQIEGFTGAIYKSFKTKEEALRAFHEDYRIHISKNAKKSEDNFKNDLNKTFFSIENNSVAVDAACSGNPGLMEYQCVETISKKLIFHRGPFEDGTNNVGEFLGLVHILALLDKHNKHDVTVYTDSKTALSWVKKKKVKTTLIKTPKNETLFEMIEKAENWLNTHIIRNPVIKWETELWGEIPADFGRK